jgi:hypothetical protein
VLASLAALMVVGELASGLAISQGWISLPAGYPG